MVDLKVITCQNKHKLHCRNYDCNFQKFRYKQLTSLIPLRGFENHGTTIIKMTQLSYSKVFIVGESKRGVITRFIFCPQTK